MKKGKIAIIFLESTFIVLGIPKCYKLKHGTTILSLLFVHYKKSSLRKIALVNLIAIGYLKFSPEKRLIFFYNAYMV